MANKDSNLTPISLYAFWEYNGTSGKYLHGTATHMDDKGRVEVVGYTGFRFKPVLLLPLDAGKRLGESIDRIHNEAHARASEIIKNGEAEIAELLRGASR